MIQRWRHDRADQAGVISAHSRFDAPPLRLRCCSADLKRQTSDRASLPGARVRSALCVDVRPLLQDGAHESSSARTAVPSVGRCAKGRRPQAPVGAPERSASSAPGFPERRATRHAPHAPGSVEPPHAPVLPRAALGLCPRLRALRLPLGGVLHAGDIHCIVEAPDAKTLSRAMNGLEVRMARALNKVMHRTGPVFADRYHSQLLTSPRQSANAIRYVLANWIIHAEPAPSGVDPYCSAASHDCGPPRRRGALVDASRRDMAQSTRLRCVTPGRMCTCLRPRHRLARPYSRCAHFNTSWNRASLWRGL